MPYVRKHGNQVAIVHGERDEAGHVQQKVLFTLYSRPEAEAAIGARDIDPPLNFHGLIETRNEGIRFDWPKIDAAIGALKHELPESWDYPSSGVEPMLRTAIVEMTRALFAADPQSVFSASQALKQHRSSLLLLRELVDDRLTLVDRVTSSRWNNDNAYGWVSRLAGRGVPPEAEEWLDAMRERGEDDRAEALAHVLVEAWPTFADGYNTLGLIALDRCDYEAALGWFARTMEVGRKLFPKRIAKSRWWSDHDTRPYMRGMRNTTLTLLWMGRDEDVLTWCDRLESECFDADTAGVQRAAAYLNLGRWQEAHDMASRYIQIWPEQDFVAAFAAFELGDRHGALARWLHAAIQRPRTARMLTGGTTRARPSGHAELADHNGGVSDIRAIGRYLKRRAAQKFFAAITAAPEVVALAEEHAAAVVARHADRTDDRTAYERVREMESPEFARKHAKRLEHLIRPPLRAGPA